MNRAQRRYKYDRPRNGKKKSKEIEEVLAPRWRRHMQSRCCYITPERDSFARLTSSDPPSQHQIPAPADPRSPTAPVLNTIFEPVKHHPQVIIISKPKPPPVYPDMIAVPKVKKITKQIFPYVPSKIKPNAPCQLKIITTKSGSTLLDEKIISDLTASEDGMDTKCKAILRVPKSQQELRKSRRNFSRRTIETGSQYVNPSEYASIYEKIIQTGGFVLRQRDEETLTQYHNLPKQLHISEVPHIKLMAVKFAKYKKDNIELRKLEEKVVCMEYDVFDKEIDDQTPVQRMRAFFSIKPTAGAKEENEVTELFSTIKNKFNTSTEDLEKLNQKEIEVIDGKIVENQPYLSDLRKLLRRKENAQKNKTTLNLQALYEQGKMGFLDFDTNFETKIPKEELEEIRNMILENCKSSVHGIRRRTVKNSSKIFDELDQNTMSQSLMAELLRESNKNVTDSLYKRFLFL